MSDKLNVRDYDVNVFIYAFRRTLSSMWGSLFRRLVRTSRSKISIQNIRGVSKASTNLLSALAVHSHDTRTYSMRYKGTVYELNRTFSKANGVPMSACLPCNMWIYIEAGIPSPINCFSDLAFAMSMRLSQVSR